jgi:hypothetical protein
MFFFMSTQSNATENFFALALKLKAGANQLVLQYTKPGRTYFVVSRTPDAPPKPDTSLTVSGQLKFHSDDLAIDIEYTDLLFIDTKHTEERTYLELKKHAEKAKKYLAFHDVNPARFATPLGIKKYLDEYPGIWKEYYRDEIDCGFLVLQRI